MIAAYKSISLPAYGKRMGSDGGRKIEEADRREAF